jgi:hypothetical protein
LPWLRGSGVRPLPASTVLTSARTCHENRSSLIAPTSRLATGLLRKKRLKRHRLNASEATSILRVSPQMQLTNLGSLPQFVMPGHGSLPCADYVNLSALPGVRVLTPAKQEDVDGRVHRRAEATPSFGRLRRAEATPSFGRLRRAEATPSFGRLSPAIAQELHL